MFLAVSRHQSCLKLDSCWCFYIVRNAVPGRWDSAGIEIPSQCRSHLTSFKVKKASIVSSFIVSGIDINSCEPCWAINVCEASYDFECFYHVITSSPLFQGHHVEFKCNLSSYTLQLVSPDTFLIALFWTFSRTSLSAADQGDQEGGIKNDLRIIWSLYKMIAYIMNFVHNDRFGLLMMIYTPSKLIYSSVHIDRVYHFIRDHFTRIPLYT